MSDSQPAPLKLLLDQGIPADAAILLRERGYDCLHVSELGMQQAQDESILSYAHGNGFVVITLDADFHSLIAVRGMRGPSVVRLRREGCRAQMVVTLLERVLRDLREDLVRGALVSVKERKTTSHRLPVGERWQ